MKVHFKHWRNECPAWIQHRTITVVNFSGHVERPGSARTVVFEGRLPSCRLPWIPRPARWCEKHRNKSDSKWSESRFNVLGLVLSGSQVVYISYTSIPRWANFHLLRATRVAPKQLPNIPWIPYHELPHLVNIFIFKILALHTSMPLRQVGSPEMSCGRGPLTLASPQISWDPVHLLKGR